jgi:toxin CptA
MSRPTLKHNAPYLVYPVKRSIFLGWVLGLIWLLGALLAAQWYLRTDHAGVAVVAVGLSVLIPGLLSLRTWLHSPAGELRWDVQYWHWMPSRRVLTLSRPSMRCVLDFDSALLLKVGGSGGSGVWLWAERAAFPDRWQDLRRAVFSPGRPDTAKSAGGRPAVAAERLA